MRHLKHRYSLGVKKEHRSALIANLAAALFRHGRIQTTLIKAKALRPFAEKMISFAKRAHLSSNPGERLHCLRLCVARVRDKAAVRRLFSAELVQEFVDRPGGYTRIYKMLPRLGDAAPMGLIELIARDGESLRSNKKALRETAAQPVSEAANAKA